MPTTSAPGTLSERLRSARGEPAKLVKPAKNEIVVVPFDTTAAEQMEQPIGKGRSRCMSSVMPGQRCSRIAVAGDTLCSNHRAMVA